MLAIAFGFIVRVDAADLQVFEAAVQGKTTFLNQITGEHPDLFFNMDDRYNHYTNTVIEMAKSNNQFLLASGTILSGEEKNEFIKKGFKILKTVEEAKDFYNNHLNPIKIARKEQEELAEVF
ncbi:hypothetical protein RPF65_24535, partial [Enterobacter hormaechei subsp. steigerwaltii]|uniref:hypothetical protein n=1 Tax=Enterobacter hormaechei TaxID=158836 RepID=UPI0039BF2DC9